MRLSMTVGLIVAILLLIGPALAQDKGSTTPLSPDLPLEKPVPETPPEEEEEEEEPPEEEPPPEEAPPEEAPPEEKPPETPPPEFFDEPIETSEVVFVLDRTGSMAAPSSISGTDENGNPLNNATKIDVSRIELIKTINDFSENIKFALVGYSSPVSASWDPNWDMVNKKWSAWPPANGEPAPVGAHGTASSVLPVWPTNKTLVKATPENKASAVAWAQQYLSTATIGGHTSICAGMSVGLKMVSAAPPGVGPGGEPKKSATALYLLTDGTPNVIGTTMWGSALSGWPYYDATWQDACSGVTKTTILSENIHRAVIYTLGIGMNNACPNAVVWNPAISNWNFYPTEFNDKCRKFLTELAEATGGHYREVSQ